MTQNPLPACLQQAPSEAALTESVSTFHTSKGATDQGSPSLRLIAQSNDTPLVVVNESYGAQQEKRMEKQDEKQGREQDSPPVEALSNSHNVEPKQGNHPLNGAGENESILGPSTFEILDAQAVAR